VLAFAAFVLGLGIFFVIGIFDIEVVKPMAWGDPALSVYIRGGGPLEWTLYIPTHSIRLTVFSVLLLAEITSGLLVARAQQQHRTR